MKNDYSCQVFFSKSDKIDLRAEDVIDTEDENTDGASTVIETKLRNVMTQGEMDILTTWFPKAAQMLAGVLRDRTSFRDQPRNPIESAASLKRSGGAASVF
jgi:hypothetical protein